MTKTMTIEKASIKLIQREQNWVVRWTSQEGEIFEETFHFLTSASALVGELAKLQ